jgi:tetratricopeptide (TPR) repeat protein
LFAEHKPSFRRPESPDLVEPSQKYLRGERRSFVKFHPSDLVLEELYLSQGDEHRVLLTHIVRCRRCLARFLGVTECLTKMPMPCGEGVGDSATCYEEALDRSEILTADQERVIEKERSGAPGLFVEVTKLSPEQQRLLIRNSPRFRTWGLCELLLERCMATTVRDSRGAQWLASLALEVAARLDSSFYRKGLVQDLHARAWGYLGNARRVGADLRSAEDAFLKAEVFLQNGSRDPVELAVFLDLKASLRRAQRRFPEALKLLRRAVSIFFRHGHLHRAGRSLVNMSTIHHCSGELKEAVPLLYEALKMIDSDQEPRLELCVRHNLIDDLAETGQFFEAQKLYRESRPLYRSFPDAVTQNRRRWVKGKISLGLGRTKQAEKLLLAACDGFAAEDLPYDTALVSLDLAIVYAREGRTADLKRLAQEMLPIFSSLQIHREALAALTFLRKALDAEQASFDLVSRVAKYLRRAKHDPGLRFEP